MNLADFHNEEFQQFVLDHSNDDPALLLLKYQGKTGFDLKAAAQQISARQKVKKKLPEWVSNRKLIFPASISLEQSSSEQTAKFKGQNRAGKSFIDLTGGFGVDAYYVGQNFIKAIYCERNEELCATASHNFEILAPGKFDVLHGDGLNFLKKIEEEFDTIFVDPARRGKGNQKLYKLSDCEPDVVSSWELMKGKARHVLFKVSPMLDISQALRELPEIQKVIVLSIKNDVKEILLEWSQESESTEVKIEVNELSPRSTTFKFTSQEEAESKVSLGEAEKFLIEPLAGILKAGAFKAFGSRYDLRKLDPNSHLYTSTSVPSDVPARVFEVIAEINTNKKEIKKRFPGGKVNVITRNYAMGADTLKKKLGLKDGGNDFLIGTKTLSGFKLFHCRKTNG